VGSITDKKSIEEIIGETSEISQFLHSRFPSNDLSEKEITEIFDYILA
jgi:hypothetical protein